MSNEALTTKAGVASSTGTALAWIGSGLAIIAAILVLVPGPGYHFGAWGLGTAFTLIRWGAYCGAAAAALSLIGIIVLVSTRARRWRLFAIAGIIIGGLAIGIPWSWARHAGDVPPIHDITTNTSNPPQFSAVLALRKNARNSPVYGGAAVAAQQHEAYPDIKPIILNVPPATAFSAAVAIAGQDGWKIAAQNADTGHIEATDTTLWFGFKDDVVIRIRPQGQGSLIDIRSASRIGKSDIGKNAARVREFTRQIRERVRKGA